MRLALYQPDIAQNTGTILRLCACLGAEAHIIEPAGFPVSDRALRRAGMDYLDHVQVVRHVSWEAFEAWRKGTAARSDAEANAMPPRLLLLTTKATTSYLSVRYRPGDILLLGRESAGVPDAVHAAVDLRLKIPMRAGMRSLNVAMAAAMVAGEMMRQELGAEAAP
jgi:tRNA (cytidine/uridine-2'-O-)-methyltransferase